MTFSYVLSCLLCDELNKRKNIISKTRRLCFVCSLQLSYFLLCTYVNCVLFLVIRYCSLFCLHNENDKIKRSISKRSTKKNNGYIKVKMVSSDRYTSISWKKQIYTKHTFLHNTEFSFLQSCKSYSLF